MGSDRESLKQLPGGRCQVVEDALDRWCTLGTSEFHISHKKMAQVLEYVLEQVPRPLLSLNRPQTGGGMLVHRVEWYGLVFTCISARPFVVT